MQLEIITPEKIFFSGEVDMVTLPGAKGLFTILNNHAPIISALEKGIVTYNDGQEEATIKITSGFVEGHDNIVTVSVEGIEEE
ncbi:MAG: ATP synthase F1 subunit epsilon [Paludibacteraceae bacterium]